MNSKKRNRDTLENNNSDNNNNNNINNNMNNNNNNNNNMDNNNNNSNNNNENSIKIYNSVFNNSYIKKIIFNYLTKYNILSINMVFETIQEWEQFKYKQYLYKITLGFNLELIQLPENIRHVVIPIPSAKKKKNTPPSRLEISVPDHIESVSFSEYIDFGKLKSLSPSITSIGSKLHTLHLTNENGKKLPIELPQSITDLIINEFDQPLKKNVLPKCLKKLSIGGMDSFEDGCFPESLVDVSISRVSPLVINQFSTFSALVKLDYSSDCCELPIGNDIQFPNTIQDLKITCFTFNTKLPDKLTSLFLVVAELNHEIQFPSSLEYLYVYVRDALNKPVFENQQAAPTNLKTLHYHESCSSIVDSNGNSVLPNQLESLVIWGKSFNQELKASHLPSSLTYLDMGDTYSHPLPQLPSSLTYLKVGRSFNQVIDINVLPSSLETLIIYNGNYTQAINPLAIPKQLKLLTVSLSIDFSILKTLSTTHPNTVLPIDDTGLFTSNFYDPSNTQMRVLRLPASFRDLLSTLQLQDKSNLEYLHLGRDFCQVIQLSDLPTQNNIKTLELGNRSNITINLEYFKNLETIVIQPGQSTTPIITSSKDQNGCYNNYNLKTIFANPSNSRFLSSLDIDFYQFLKKSKSVSDKIIR